MKNAKNAGNERGRRLRRGIGLAMILLGSACAGDKGTLAVNHDPADAMGVLTVSPDAVILAAGQTRQLTVSGVSLTGVPITDFDQLSYLLATPADTERVRLSTDGSVTALSAGTLILVNVLARRHDEFRGAQALLQVTPAPVPGATLSIQPTDSTKLAAGSLKTMAPTLRNPVSGLSVATPIVRYSVKTQDLKRVILYRPQLTIGGLTLQVTTAPSATVSQVGALDSEGSAWVYGAVDAYGTVVRDSVLLTFSYPYTGTIAVNKTGATIALSGREAAQALILAPGATITFSSGISSSTDPQLTIGYTFDGPAAPAAAVPPSSAGGSAGNVTPLAPGQSSVRRFLVAGTYKWTASAVGGRAPWDGQAITGTIIIR